MARSERICIRARLIFLILRVPDRISQTAPDDLGRDKTEGLFFFSDEWTGAKPTFGYRSVGLMGITSKKFYSQLCTVNIIRVTVNYSWYEIFSS